MLIPRGALLSIGLILLPLCSWSQTIKIPVGDPMARNPVSPQSKLIAKKATFGGVERNWYEYVPASYTGSASVPLVVAVHGGNADGVWMFEKSSWAQIADQVGFIVVYPKGSAGNGKLLRWNAYEKFNTSPDMALTADNGVDEAKFFKALIEKMEQDYRIDPARVYMHGQSNGGMMTSYFGLRYPEMLAAMAVSSAPPAIEVMNAYPVTTKLPTYFWGGETDTVAGQYNPANKSRSAICQEFAEFWARINHSEIEPKLRLDGPYNTKIYAGEAEVRNTEFRNGVHTLPFTTAYLTWNDFFLRFARGKTGGIERLVPDSAQAAPADVGAVAIKLGASFALVNHAVVRLGKTPDAVPVMVPGAPSIGTLIPADFAAVAAGGAVEQTGESEVRITTKAGVASFTVGSAAMIWNGKPAMLDSATARVGSGTGGELMISVRALPQIMPGKIVSSRKDFYKNDISYAGDRPADLSAQTIAYIERKLVGKVQ